MTRFPRWPLIKFLSERKSFISRTAEYCQPRCNFSEMWSVHTTRYSVIFQKFPSRVRVVQKNPSSIRVAGTRWTLIITHQAIVITLSYAYHIMIGQSGIHHSSNSKPFSHHEGKCCFCGPSIFQRFIKDFTIQMVNIFIRLYEQITQPLLFRMGCQSQLWSGPMRAHVTEAG